ncbi:hypothetical protein WJ972_10335 [Achromobacter insuavis]
MKHATRMGSLIAALLLTSIAGNAMAAADAAAKPGHARENRARQTVHTAGHTAGHAAGRARRRHRVPATSAP